MAKYRKIDPRIWNDAKFMGLSDNGKLVFLFLLTHPHMTALGAMRASVPGLAAELRWEDKAFREAFGQALSMGIVKHDCMASFLWLPNFIKYNPPESPNVIKSWAASLDLLPECEMKTECLYRVKAFTEGLTKSFAEALPKDFTLSGAGAGAGIKPNNSITQQEKLFIDAFKENEEKLKHLYPHVTDYEAQKETCVAHYRNGPNQGADVFPAILKWFNRIPKGGHAKPGYSGIQRSGKAGRNSPSLDDSLTEEFCSRTKAGEQSRTGKGSYAGDFKDRSDEW